MSNIITIKIKDKELSNQLVNAYLEFKSLEALYKRVKRNMNIQKEIFEKTLVENYPECRNMDYKFFWALDEITYKGKKENG